MKKLFDQTLRKGNKLENKTKNHCFLETNEVEVTKTISYELKLATIVFYNSSPI